jgi:UDPglucose 6-dehydrogenase
VNRVGPPISMVGISGLGYMGLATGLAFAAHGLSVIGYDVKPEIRESLIRGVTPYREQGLAELLRRQVRAGRFSTVDSPHALVEFAEGIFLCLPTPSLPSGRIDLRPLKKGTAQLGRALRREKGYRLVVVKSTVVPGTTETVVEPMLRRLSGKSPRELGVAVNPEFLAEGTMVQDAVHPARVVLGTKDPRSRDWLRKAYRPFRVATFFLSPSGAELVKYSSNAFLALKVSYANEISRLSDSLGINVDAVLDAVGHDPRIGERFLRAGPGFGGSCFEKDLRSLVMRAADLGVQFRSGVAALQINEEQLDYVVDSIRGAVGPLSGKKLAILGLAFKAGTDDVRQSRALLIAHELVAAGATVCGHDPVALENFRRAWEDLYLSTDGKIDLYDTVENTLDGADAAILQADWPVYTRWPNSWTRRMRHPLLVDLRRAVDPRIAHRAGLTLVGLGAGDAKRADYGRGGRVSP